MKYEKGPGESPALSRCATSADQCRDGSLVGRIDSFQAIDSVEGSIRGEDRVDSAIDREGGEDGVASVELAMRFEQVDPSLNVIGLYGMPPGERGDTAGRFRRAEEIPGSPLSLVHELLEKIGARLSLQVTSSSPAHDLAAWLLIGMLPSEGVDEDRSVVKEAPHAPGHLRIVASSSSLF